MNKIIRAAYGAETMYQNLSFEAIEIWEEWNRYIAAGGDLPPGMTSRDEIWVNNGNLQICDSDRLPPFETRSIKNMEKAGKRHTQVVVTNPEDVEQAERSGFAFAVDPFHRVGRSKPYQALLDTSGGFVYADRACRLALHLCRQAGVKFWLGRAGEFQAFISDRLGNITGVHTADGERLKAKLTIVAGGGWTQQMVPELDGLCETTAGSVAVVEIPKSSPLFDRFAPHNFPTWTYKMRDGAAGGLYGFPRDDNGLLKFGYRGVKYTNPQPHRSVPVTRWTKPASITRVPLEALTRIRGFIKEFLPEIGEAGLDISFTRLCWYNDSFDNHFVIDSVPKRPGLMVATGGSGHAFMFFPNIGKYVADRVEGNDQCLLDHWKWRSLAPDQKPVNKLMEGLQGARALQNQPLYRDDDLRLQDESSNVSLKPRL